MLSIGCVVAVCRVDQIESPGARPDAAQPVVLQHGYGAHPDRHPVGRGGVLQVSDAGEAADDGMGISNSMLEALGMGIPTIVTDCPVGGSKMFVHTGDNGVLIQMENKNDLVSAMTLIATNSRYVKHISNNAIKIREQLAAPNICQKWLQLL